MMKQILALIILSFLPGSVFAQTNQTESLTITTYYPSPSGVYRTLRLHPSDEPTAGVYPGLMYYNQTENVIKFRNDTAWVNLTGGGGGYLAQESGTGNIYIANSTSNVGIGTTTPGKKLDVTGDIRASGVVLAAGNIQSSGKIIAATDMCLANGICLSQLSFNGSCGSANKVYPYTAASYGSDTFCGTGSPSAIPAFPALGGSASWTCPAVNGVPITCTASRGGAPVNGLCGAAATTYPYTAGGFSGALCNAGTPSPGSPTFPAIGGSSNWSCLGINGGSSPSCTASRGIVPFLVNGAHTELDCTAIGGELMSVGASNVCRFNAASCPNSQWAQYLNWSTTSSVVAYFRGCVQTGGSPLYTGEHAWANIAQEYVGCVTYAWNSSCPCCVSWASSGCPSATITQIGCY